MAKNKASYKGKSSFGKFDLPQKKNKNGKGFTIYL